jgi:hypothetical protein
MLLKLPNILENAIQVKVKANDLISLGKNLLHSHQQLWFLADYVSLLRIVFAFESEYKR